jgi:hypothetical protein
MEIHVNGFDPRTMTRTVRLKITHHGNARRWLEPPGTDGRDVIIWRLYPKTAHRSPTVTAWQPNETLAIAG